MSFYAIMLAAAVACLGSVVFAVMGIRHHRQSKQPLFTKFQQAAPAPRQVPRLVEAVAH